MGKIKIKLKPIIATGITKSLESGPMAGGNQTTMNFIYLNMLPNDKKMVMD